MSRLTKIFCGVTLLTVPTIAYGGYFLLSMLADWSPATFTPFQQSMFRAGHAHAGVLVLLCLIAQILADHARLPQVLNLLARVSFVAAALLISGGFFAAAAGDGVTEPTYLIFILYLGIAELAFAVVTLGIGLLRAK
ncbi:hypothetical protein LZZ85_03620 [Terrimonas sp. NA20]|uniref:DUF4345 domain-containing protein n=1 Tax=Terrimonas ginsenosidimutans TaxID=2908004 RepID=A0ABS9KM07_9BACT|nr:hypothetical protein [Terrimonas ginsenosidimutans]MCG2613349.1 hypothetical protein [Terrimonas ginsenosidimutans]